MRNELYQKDVAKAFYEQRYEQGGYMDEWPAEKLQRVKEIVRGLPLPKKGEALDFGCGNGVFTGVLKEALPEWTIYGSDISEVAVKNATERFPQCSFFVSDLDRPVDKQFDFVFSHHVLEHVFDIRKTVAEIKAFVKPGGSTMHVFPCGNEGSFEHRICTLRTDGINAAMENRFFFEDEGHVRRLTTDQTSAFMAEVGLNLELDYYSNQHYGALDWLSGMSVEFIERFTEPAKAKDASGTEELRSLRNRLLQLRRQKQLARDPKAEFMRIVNAFKVMIKSSLNLLRYPFAKMAVDRLKAAKEQEWKQSNRKRNGSEMYLFYRSKN
jgi:SAM-dependent methyltransferase